jgi:hypothetical protein
VESNWNKHLFISFNDRINRVVRLWVLFPTRYRAVFEMRKYWKKWKVMGKTWLKEGWLGQRNLRDVLGDQDKYKTISKRSSDNTKINKHIAEPYSGSNRKEQTVRLLHYICFLHRLSRIVALGHYALGLELWVFLFL